MHRGEWGNLDPEGWDWERSRKSPCAGREAYESRGNECSKKNSPEKSLRK